MTPSNLSPESRSLESRQNGFDSRLQTPDSGLSFIFQIGERRPARVNVAALAGALARVQVSAADGAQTLAFFAAQAARRERERDLLAHKLVQVNRVALVGRKPQVRSEERRVGKE